MIKYQHHKHTFTCKKVLKGGSIDCRFGFPIPPMDKTTILEPLSNNIKSENYFRKIKENLRARIKNGDLTDDFNTFLNSLYLTKDEYYDAIRSSLHTPKVFLKRSLNEILTNNYNSKILFMQESNMDIQFVLNPYACVNYVLNYINKGDKGN